MIDTPQIVQTTAQLTAYIHLMIARSEIAKVMGPGLQELMTTLASQGIKPVGPWFTHHRKMEPATFDFEISVTSYITSDSGWPSPTRTVARHESGSHHLPRPL